MPSSTKPKNETSNEVQDPLKQALSLVEKKVRNLEKRKLKLDMYKVKLAEGAILEKDQLEAVNKYNDVSCNLEFAKELLKQFMALTQDAEKLMKRQMKKERAERILNEHKRLKQVLLIQNMFDNFEIEQVRNDFRNGCHSAVVLTEENLTQLDNLWKLISPESRENEKEFTSASEHLCNLLDAREKAILGTTYKELKELIDLILNCGYFENAPRYEKTNSSSQETSHANKAEETKPSEEPVSTVTSDVKSPETNPVPEEPESINVEIEKKQQHQQQQQPEPVLPVKEVHETNTNSSVGTTDNNIDGDSFFSTGTSFPRQRPFQEIVSSVQGSFNFLQESTIDLESPQHLDPAVVVAHPMPTVRHPQTQSEVNVNTLAQTGYANTGYDQPPPPPVAVPQPPKPQQPVVQTNASMHPVPQPVPQMPAPQANIVPQQTAQPPPTAVPMDVTPVDQQQSHAATILNTSTATVVSQPQLDYTNQTYSQNAISQNLPNDSLFHSVEDGPAPIALMGQPVNDTTVSQFEIPAIPMPNQTQLQDGGINPYVKDTSSQSQGVKKFTNLNANAAVFQSMNANAAVFQPQHTDTSTDGKGQLSPQATDYNQGGSYSTSYFPRGTFPNRNFRGNRGRGGLNNGFNRNSNSGGSGGGSGGGGGGNRTGYTNRSSYPNFPSREYRAATENYSMLNGASFGNGFPKRSSSGPGSTGGNASTVTRGTTSSGGGGGGGNSSGGGGGGGSLKSGPGIAAGASPSQTTYWTNFAVRGQPRGGSIRGGRGTGGGLGRATFPQQPLAQQ